LIVILSESVGLINRGFVIDPFFIGQYRIICAAIRLIFRDCPRLDILGCFFFEPIFTLPS
jgi:hypothetical protein